jgi:DNA-binding MarR family transcriptional regulator
MLNADFYNLMMNTSGALFGAVAAVRTRTAAAQDLPPLNPLLQFRRGFAESPAWFLVQALEFDPEPLSVTNLRVRDIYASESLVQALLDLMASEKWFDRVNPTKQSTAVYALTEAGRAALETLRSDSRRIMSALEPLSAAEISRLENLLMRLIEASLNSPEPPGVWCLAHSRHRAPAQQAAPLVKIAQYFADFNAFRDDAHMAAWQPHQVEGYVWEAFSLVWSETATSAEALFDQLAHRGYSWSDYAAALEALVQRGWLVEAENGTPKIYRLTVKGQAIRQEAEHLTDEYFYTPWSCLTEAEVAELHDLLLRLQSNLSQL